MQLTAKVKPAREKLSVRMRVLRAAFYLIMIVMVLLYLLPFWGTITTSFKTAEEALTTNPLAFPDTISLDAYADSFAELKDSLITSLIITAGGAFGSVALGSVCAYGLSKYRFKFCGTFCCSRQPSTCPIRPSSCRCSRRSATSVSTIPIWA